MNLANLSKQQLQVNAQNQHKFPFTVRADQAQQNSQPFGQNKFNTVKNQDQQQFFPNHPNNSQSQFEKPNINPPNIEQQFSPNYPINNQKQFLKFNPFNKIVSEQQNNLEKTEFEQQVRVRITKNTNQQSEGQVTIIVTDASQLSSYCANISESEIERQTKKQFSLQEAFDHIQENINTIFDVNSPASLFFEKQMTKVTKKEKYYYLVQVDLKSQKVENLNEIVSILQQSLQFLMTQKGWNNTMQKTCIITSDKLVQSQDQDQYYYSQSLREEINEFQFQVSDETAEYYFQISDENQIDKGFYISIPQLQYNVIGQETSYNVSPRKLFQKDIVGLQVDLKKQIFVLSINSHSLPPIRLPTSFSSVVFLVFSQYPLDKIFAQIEYMPV